MKNYICIKKAGYKVGICIDKYPGLYQIQKTAYSVSKILLYQKMLFSIGKDRVSQNYFPYQKIVSVAKTNLSYTIAMSTVSVWN